jgi:hypothetical protein
MFICICMTYGTFIYLVRKLEPFVKFRAIMFVKAPFKPKKVILSWCYINLHMGLVQTLLLIDSILDFLNV